VVPSAAAFDAYDLHEGLVLNHENRTAGAKALNDGGLLRHG